MIVSQVDRQKNNALTTDVDTAVGVLKNGGVVCVPTDTLYGLAASAVNEGALERLYRIKGRLKSMALPLLLSDVAQLTEYAIDVPEVASRLAEAFLPGPLTLVLRKATGVSSLVSGGLDTVAVRVPDHWMPRAIVRGLGIAITGTSANRTGMPGATTAAEAREQLAEDIDLVVDGGRCPRGIASTILDLSGASPVILRIGSIPARDIEDVCGENVTVSR